MSSFGAVDSSVLDRFGSFNFLNVLGKANCTLVVVMLIWLQALLSISLVMCFWCCWMKLIWYSVVTHSAANLEFFCCQYFVLVSYNKYYIIVAFEK